MNLPLDLDGRLAHWADEPLWRHLGALALIALVATVRWHHCLLSSDPLIDEATYLAAFRAMASGESPYSVGSYHYTPLFAWVGGRLLERVGDTGVLWVLRSGSLAGLSLAVWCSLAWLTVSQRIRLAFAMAFVALAPAVGAGFCTGNLSFAVIGVILLALTQWPLRSAAGGAIPAGLALGATVVAKPLAPLALVALLFHRPAVESRRHLIAGLVGGLTAAALLLPMLPRLSEMSAQPIHRLSYARSFSLQRILSLAGIEISGLVILLAGALLLAGLVRLRPLDRSGLVTVAVTASVLVTPIIWNHTLVLTLPVQAMALAVATHRRRVAPPGTARKHWYEISLVVLAVLSIQLAGGAGAVDELPRMAQLIFLSVPYLAPGALMIYVVFSTGSTGSTDSTGERRKR